MGSSSCLSCAQDHAPRPWSSAGRGLQGGWGPGEGRRPSASPLPPNGIPRPRSLLGTELDPGERLRPECRGLSDTPVRGAPVFQRVSWRGHPFRWAWKTGAWASRQLLAFRGVLETPCQGSLVRVGESVCLAVTPGSARSFLTGCEDAQRRTRAVTRSAAGQRPCWALGAVLTTHWSGVWEEFGFQPMGGLFGRESTRVHPGAERRAPGYRLRGCLGDRDSLSPEFLRLCVHRPSAHHPSICPSATRPSTILHPPTHHPSLLFSPSLPSPFHPPTLPSIYSLHLITVTEQWDMS